MTTKKRGMTARMLSSLPILVLGLGAALIGLAGTSSAFEEVGDLPAPVMSDAADCVPSTGAKAFYSDWTNDGGLITTHDSNPPGTDTATVRYDPEGTEKHVTQQGSDDTSVRRWLVWTGGPVGDSGPSADAPLGSGGWNTPAGDPNGVPHQGHADGVPYRTGEGNSPWFMWKNIVTPGQQEQSHTDYKWQKQTRTLTPAATPTQCVAGTASDDQTLRDADCETGTVTETVQFRLEQTPGAQDWGPWQTSDVTTRDMRPTELAQCDGGGNPRDPGNPGNGETAGNAEVLGIEANAPAGGAAAAAPAAAPTAVDAGFGAEDQGINPMLWLLVGGAMTFAGAALGFAPTRERGKRSW